MTSSSPQDQRKYPRHKVRLHNAARIITDQGDCIADIMDISEDGIGLGYYDFFCAMDLSGGSEVKLRILLDLDAELVCAVDRPEIEDESEKEDLLVIEAVVKWSYLNRLGLTFKNGPSPTLLRAILDIKES